MNEELDISGLITDIYGAYYDPKETVCDTYTDTYSENNTISYPYSFSDMLERNMGLETKRQELLTNLDELKKLLESGRGDIKEQLDKFDISWCEFKLLVDGTDI